MGDGRGDDPDPRGRPGRRPAGAAPPASAPATRSTVAATAAEARRAARARRDRPDGARLSPRRRRQRPGLLPRAPRGRLDIPAILVTGFGDEACSQALRAGSATSSPRRPTTSITSSPTVERVLAQVQTERQLQGQARAPDRRAGRSLAAEIQRTALAESEARSAADRGDPAARLVMPASTAIPTSATRVVASTPASPEESSGDGRLKSCIPDDLTHDPDRSEHRACRDAPELSDRIAGSCRAIRRPATAGTSSAQPGPTRRDGRGRPLAQSTCTDIDDQMHG